jgi:hypothetical protein
MPGIDLGPPRTGFLPSPDESVRCYMMPGTIPAAQVGACDCAAPRHAAGPA